MALTDVPVELSSTPGVVDNSNAAAITIDSSEDVSFSEDIKLGDGKKAIFGAGDDLQIYHSGSASVISDEGTGNLLIQTNGTAVKLNKGASENMLVANVDGSVDLYYDDAKKLATTSEGIEVTGTAHLSSYAPILSFTDTNSFTDVNDKFIVRASTSRGNIQWYDDSASTTTELMTFLPSGEVLVGTTTANPTSSGVNVAGQEFSTTGGVRSTVDANPAATFNRKTDDGQVILVRKDGTTVGSIATITDDLTIFSTTASHIGLRFGNTRLQPTDNAGATTDGVSDLGFSNSRFKEGFLSSNLNIINPSEDERGLSITDQQDGGQNLKFLYNASSNVGRVINDQVDQLRFNGAEGAMINTPSFSAYATSNQTTVTNSAATKINFGSQIADTAGGNYATSTSRFTAPHDGTYFFSTSITFAGGDGSDDTMYVDYRVNNAFYTAYRFKDNWRFRSRSGIEGTANYSLLIPLSEGDYVEVFYAGTAQAIVIDGGNSKFSGFAVSLT